MKKSYYSYQPEPVLVHRYADYVHVDLALNPTRFPSDDEHGGESWVADTHSFWEKDGMLNLDDLRAHPEDYLHYVPEYTRQAAKAQAQKMLDGFRSEGPIVPVATYRAGMAVCNRAGDQVKLLAGLQMGGLPYYELASGEVVSLSVADIRSIAADIAAAETAWQQAKQRCWASIESAQGLDDIAEALAAFASVLGEYAGEFVPNAEDSDDKVGWMESLLSGWGIRESWAKIVAGSVVGALAASGFLTGCSFPAFHAGKMSPPTMESSDFSRQDHN